MGNGIHNTSLGRMNEFNERVRLNDPAASVLEVFLWTGVETDDNIGDATTISGVAATVLTESAATNYASKILTDTDMGALSIDTGANHQSADISDIVWVSLGPGTAITRLTIGYDADGDANDANTVAVAYYDFSVTPNGGNVTAEINANGLWQADRV